VIGLTTAAVLSKNPKYSITVVAKHMPGDYDIEYASPWAGANYLPVGKPGSLLQKCEIATWPELERICRDIPEAGIHSQETRVYGREKDADSPTGQWFAELCKEDAWFKNVVPNVRFFSCSQDLPLCPPSFGLRLHIFSFQILIPCSHRFPLIFVSRCIYVVFLISSSSLTFARAVATAHTSSYLFTISN
jgi:hypothetical protein